MNKVILTGRLTRDPEIRYSNGQEPVAVARFHLAVDRSYTAKEAERQTDFISCVAFRKTAEFLEKYCSKGTKLLIEGRWQTGSYTNKDGVKVYTNDCVIDHCEFAESKREPGGQLGGHTPADPSVGEDGFMTIPDAITEELPFN